ncbi:MAG: hypothetical protein AAGI46_04885 [Planctomycetota bacterium]
MATDDDLYDFKDDDPPPVTRPPRPRIVQATADGAPPKLAYRNANAGKKPVRRHKAGEKISREDYAKLVEAEIARREWMVPTISLGVCAVIFLLIGLIVDGLTGAAIYGLIFGILTFTYTFVAIIAAFIAGSIGISTGGTLLATILQLGACSMIAATSEFSLESLIGMGGIFSFMVYVGMLIISLQIMLDMDGSEAQIFAFIFVALQFVVTIALQIAILNDLLS